MEKALLCHSASDSAGIHKTAEGASGCFVDRLL